MTQSVTGTLDVTQTATGTLNVTQTATGTLDVTQAISGTVPAPPQLNATLAVGDIVPTYGSELVTNGDMELDSSWLNFLSPVTNERSSEQAHAGTYSRKLVGDSNSDGIYQSISVTAGLWYRVTGWTYATAGSVKIQTAAAQLPLVSGLLNAASWTQTTMIGRAVATASTQLQGIQSGVTAATAYFDDFSLKALTFSSALSLVGDISRSSGTWRCTPTVAAGTQAGLAINYTDTDNLVLAYVNRYDGKAYLDKRVGGTWTNVINGAITYGPSKELAVAVSGTTYSLYYDETQVGSGQEIADSLGTAVYGFATDAANGVGTVTTSTATTYASAAPNWVNWSGTQTIPQYAGWNIPLVVITFDDGWDSQQAAYEYAIARNVLGTNYIVSDWIDTAGYLTEAQITAMDAAGWDIGNHTKAHQRFTDELVTQANIEAAIVACRDYLEGLGLTRASRHLAYPWGAYLGGDSGATTYAAMAATGMLTGRTTTKALFDVADHVPDDPYQIPGYVVNAAVSLATAKGYIDAAISNKQVVVLYLHDFTSGTPTGTEWTYSDWEALVDYIVSTRIPAITISQLYALGSGSIQYTPTEAV